MTSQPSPRSSHRTTFLLPLLFLPACVFDDDPKCVRAHLALGAGTLEHRTRGTALDDRTDAGYLAIGVEGIARDGLGLGARLEAIGSDDRMFADTVVGAPSEVRDGELFLHGTGDFGDDAFHCPLRFGLSLRSYGIRENASGSDLEWNSFGPRLEIAPDVALLQDHAVRWSLTGRLGAGFGATLVSQSGAFENWETTMGTLDVGLGTRLRFSSVSIDLGWLSRRTHYAESDPANAAVVLAADSEFEGLVLSVAATF